MRLFRGITAAIVSAGSLFVPPALAQSAPSTVISEHTPPASFAGTVRPFLEKYCQSCHNSKTRLAGINFEVLKYSRNLASHAGVWESTAHTLKVGRMPAPGSPAPPRDQAEAVIAFVESNLAEMGRQPITPRAATADWTTWQFDPERTGWARAETTLSKANVARLGLLWKTQLDAVPNRRNIYSTLTDPLYAGRVQTRRGSKDIVYVASAENNVYAIDAGTGAVLWDRRISSTAAPPHPPDGMCPNTLNATPVIDRESGTLYVLANDGKLHGLGLADGEDRMTPAEFTAPYSRNWSLNLIEGIIYTPSSRGCGGAISAVSGIDISRPNRPVERFYTSTGKASGPWGRGGVVSIPSGVIAQTADGAYDPASGRFGNTLLSLTKDLRLTDSYTPANWEYLNRKDFDLGSASPTVFEFDRWTLAAAAGKEGVVYLLDANNLGGNDHHTPLYVSPRYGNDALTYGFTGVWGSLSTWVDASGVRWVLVPMQGPPAQATAGDFRISHGKVVNGSIMAFQVKKENGAPVLVPVWISHDLDLPGMPVAANGVVYVLGTGERALQRLPRRPASSQRGAAPFFVGPPNQVNPGEPGAERDAAWLTAQDEPGGQTPGRRFSGGNDLFNAVLYALDAESGRQIFSSGELIDSWNHYGGLALAGGRVYVSTFDGRVYALGLN